MRSGFTLLEILLVLAIMVVLLALAYPSMEVMYAEYRLHAAADQVRAAWQTARSEAMDKGRPYRFAIVPGQGNFRIAPDSSDYWNGADPASGGDPAIQPVVAEEALPDGVRFSSPEATQPGADNSASALPAGSVSPDRWASTAVFLPDGTAEADVEIIFLLANTRPLSLKLRALTGVITSEILDRQEVLP